MNNYNEHLLDIIVEEFKNDDVILIISDRLLNVLRLINHPISSKILNNNTTYNFMSKITLLDIDDTDINKLDNISFSLSTKTLDKIISINDLNIDKKIITIGEIKNINRDIYINRDILFKYNRTISSFGRVINKLFPNEFKSSGDSGNDIESFINIYKSIRDINNNFELVKGDDIIKWYNHENYNGLKGTLNSSCMRHDRCTEFIKFYSVNSEKVSLLILRDIIDKNKISGRALVWNLDTPENRIFMDRIYTTNDYEIESFKEYAKKNGWLYKKDQNMYPNCKIIDTLEDNIEGNLLYMVINDFKDSEYKKYPYMDTMKYYNGNNLTNNIDLIDDGDIKTLENTNGGYEGRGNYWSDYYDEYLDIENDNDIMYCEWINDYRTSDDCYYSEYYEVTIAYSYARDEMVKCYYSFDDWDQWRKEDDYVKLSNGRDATIDYAEEECKYSEYSNQWCLYSEYSIYHDTYINQDDVVLVYTDVYKKEDFRHIDDNTWFYWEVDLNKYDIKVSRKDLEETYKDKFIKFEKEKEKELNRLKKKLNYDKKI